ncbi:class I SAM-dependent methyltransferase [Candidatus Bathyarchaeota archaeon]|nr:class I SAM-dependent methyltransferase [Candidatus Bathyarchaeota archaeon]
MTTSMLRMYMSQAKGFGHLLWHPLQLRHLIIRETRYNDRLQSKQRWIAWQKYNSARAAAAFRSTEALMRPFNVARLQTISGMFTRRLGNGLNVLDVGGGDGVLGEHLWKKGNNVTSVDLPTVAARVHRCQGLLAAAGDAERLPFASDTFDVVLASEIVEHLWDPHSFFDEAYRVLKADGHLIISTPEGIEGLRYDSHKNYFTVERLAHLLDGRFTVIEVKRLTAVRTQTPTIIVLFRKSVAPKA